MPCLRHRRSFNTQPPEGGWWWSFTNEQNQRGFNTQPPEGGWAKTGCYCRARKNVSTHSRPKAAGSILIRRPNTSLVSTHSRPKAAGLIIDTKCSWDIGFNTQPPEGGWQQYRPSSFPFKVSTHSRPKAAGFYFFRRFIFLTGVSTHSRPKAAGGICVQGIGYNARFNTQPPEGGWAG